MAREDNISTMSRIRRLSVGPKLTLRQLRADSPVIVWLLVVVFTTSLFLSATPRFFSEISDDGLSHAVREAAPINRNVSVSRVSKIAAGSDDAFSAVARGGDRFREGELPESVQSIIMDETYVVDSPRFVVSGLPGEPNWPFTAFMRMRYQEDVSDHVRLVAGVLPEPQDPVPIVLAEDAEPVLLPLYQVAVTDETLAAMEITLGDRLLMTPDRADRAYRELPFAALDYFLVLEISGIVEPIDPEEPYWYDDFQLHRPQVYENPDFVLMFPTGLMSPADYRRMLADNGGALWRYSWRYFVDPELMDSRTVGQLAGDIFNLELNFHSIDIASVGEDSVTTGLSRLIGRFLDQRRSTVAMLSLVSIGLFAVALSVIAVLAALVTARQADSMFLLRSRGASRRQLTLSRLSVGLLLSVPAAGLGLMSASLLIEGRSNMLATRAAVAVAIAATTLIVAAGLPVIRKDLGALHRGELTGPLSLRRKVAEAGIVAVAIVAIVLLRRRGLGIAGTRNDVGFDPLLAAAPALLALAVGIVTLRLYVYPVRLFSWLSAKRRDLVAFVGFRRILQQPPAARMPLVVILLAAAVAVFAGTVRLSIDHGQRESTWQEVGADYRIAGAAATTQLPQLLDVAAIDSIEASAFGLRLDSIARDVIEARDPVEFLGLEPAAYNEVTTGTRAAADLPEAVTRTQSGADIGTGANPIPAVVSREWAEFRSLATGDTFVLDFGRIEATFTVAETRDRFPGLPVDRAFVVANVDSIQAVSGVTLRPTVLYLRAPESAFDEIDAATRSARGSVLAARGRLYDLIDGAPLVAGVGRGFRLAFWLTTFFAVVAAVAAFALTSKSRLRDLAYLRTLGLSSRQAVGVTIVEQLPPVLIAAAVGSALGVGMAVLFEPGIDLTAFTGPGLEAGLRIDMTGIAIIICGLTIAVLTAVGVFGYFTRKDNLGGILRLGDE
jgi:putative ABC transport system permease protein